MNILYQPRHHHNNNNKHDLNSVRQQSSTDLFLLLKICEL